jgi:hypothetical protein
MDRINLGTNESYVKITDKPFLDPRGEAFVKAFAFFDTGTVEKILAISDEKAKSCPNRIGLNLTIAWTRALLTLPSFRNINETVTKSMFDRAAATFRNVAQSAATADDPRLERLASQISEVLGGDIAGFPHRLAVTLADKDLGLAITLARATESLATRRLVFGGEYASTVRILEQLQMGLYQQRLFYSSAVTLKKLSAIYGLHPQRIASAAALTEHVQRLSKYAEEANSHHVERCSHNAPWSHGAARLGMV